MKRYKLFVGHYNWLRQEGVKMYGEDQSQLAYYAKYNMFNCFWWALSNSKTHNIDGSYRS